MRPIVSFVKLALLCLVSDFLFRGDYSNALLHYEKGVTKLPEVFSQWAFNPRFVLLKNKWPACPCSRELHRGFITSKSFIGLFFLVSLYFISSLELHVSDFMKKLTYACLGNRLPEFVIASEVHVF